MMAKLLSKYFTEINKQKKNNKNEKLNEIISFF